VREAVLLIAVLVPLFCQYLDLMRLALFRKALLKAPHFFRQLVAFEGL
jgi:hypothetical protein